MIIYKDLNKNEISKVCEIDRRDYSDEIYQMIDGKMTIVKQVFDHRGFSKEQYNEIIKSFESLMESGGSTFGAFDGDILIGIAAVEYKFRGKDKDTVNLDGLWVSQSYRNRSIGKQLIFIAKDRARQMGAKKLYVSSCECKNTVDFYMRNGFKLAKDVDDELFQLEPNDIHMELVL